VKAITDGTTYVDLCDRGISYMGWSLKIVLL
jgi:hypothetical protein